MKRDKAFIETWGCQLNYHKSEAITGRLEKEGYEITKNLGEADLIIFNTCAVRDRSEEKVIGRIGQIKKERKENSILGLGGCMAQHSGEKLINDQQGIDFVFGSTNLDEIPELSKRIQKNNQLISLPDPKGIVNSPFKRNSDFHAWLTISQGCSNHCSYCIVPLVTGPLRSREPQEIIQEAKNLIEKGYQEIELLGQNVNAYGKDRNNSETDFASLLKELASLEVPRISFTTPHPGDLDRETLKVMNNNDNISRHLHLPLQSGSNKVLDLMNRGYHRGKYLELVKTARDFDPDINITTDIIVGHPGEKRKDFEDTLDIVKKVKFGSIYVAKYSPRPGTKSRKMEEKIPLEKKEKRLEKILKTQKVMNKEENEKFLGRKTQVLVEGKARNNGSVFGKNEFKKTTVFPGDESCIGEMVSVEVARVEGGTLYGQRRNPDDTNCYT